ncbi:hypothetical protein Pmani_028264 [Petrolisthes manimaculis]|uniref:Uncharacterized protein n=1 Tax=Petrolisthes manimaculis TaxID=1843537 RepID=A0AAE1TVV7_9EUCA|nr:hypothetical protein Pmani_028264 [Petrolisthes manimaculis]
MTWGLGLFEVSMVGQDANVTQVQLSRVVAQARRFVDGGGKEVSVGWGRRRCQWDGVEGGVGEGRSRVNPLGRHLGVGEVSLWSGNNPREHVTHPVPRSQYKSTTAVQPVFHFSCQSRFLDCETLDGAWVVNQPCLCAIEQSRRHSGIK